MVPLFRGFLTWTECAWILGIGRGTRDFSRGSDGQEASCISRSGCVLQQHQNRVCKTHAMLVRDGGQWLPYAGKCFPQKPSSSSSTLKTWRLVVDLGARQWH